MEALGFTEHTDGFNTNNVGDSVIDDTFHISTGTVSFLDSNLTTHDVDYAVTITVFKCTDERETSDDLDAIDQTITDIMNEILRPSNRVGQATIKNITPVSAQPLPLDDTNDDIIRLELSFIAQLTCTFE